MPKSPYASPAPRKKLPTPLLNPPKGKYGAHGKRKCPPGYHWNGSACVRDKGGQKGKGGKGKGKGREREDEGPTPQGPDFTPSTAFLAAQGKAAGARLGRRGRGASDLGFGAGYLGAAQPPKPFDFARLADLLKPVGVGGGKKKRKPLRKKRVGK